MLAVYRAWSTSHSRISSPCAKARTRCSTEPRAAPLPPDREPIALASSVTPDYLNVMGIPLREGRFIDEHDREGSEPVVVIDDNLARHAFAGAERRWADISGFRTWGAAPVRIVGVVGHIRHWGLAGDDQSRVRDQMYYAFAQVPAPLGCTSFLRSMSIAVRFRHRSDYIFMNVNKYSLDIPFMLGARGYFGSCNLEI